MRVSEGSLQFSNQVIRTQVKLVAGLRIFNSVYMPRNTP
jgi:hypothetical protein